MSTSAADVSIHAVSPESIFGASAACPVAARPRMTAPATTARAHHTLPPDERVLACMMSLLWWDATNQPSLVPRETPGPQGNAPGPRARGPSRNAQFVSAACFLCRTWHEPDFRWRTRWRVTAGDPL